MYIRALDRWSAVSLATTAPSPVQGEPRRVLVRGIARLLEVAVVDLVEAWRGKADAGQLGRLGEAAGDLGPQIALAVDAVKVEAEGLHPHHAVDGGKLCGDIG